MSVVKAVITTLDNLPLLKEQVAILRGERLLDEIIVVNNGSRDGTREWLESPSGAGLTIIHRENHGAGPGRNAGIDRAEPFDYVMLLDGGVRPLAGGVEKMLDYLQRRRDAHVIGIDHTDMVSDESKSTLGWYQPIRDQDTYRNTRLSETAYCLARAYAFTGRRFCEEGPFGEPGWGVDDDEMACQWNAADVAVHVTVKVHPYRRASGSFKRLFDDTGIWPNQYGSVYEKRLVWCQQNWPQYQQGIQWGEPWLTVIVRAGDRVEDTVRTIKRAHDRLRERSFPTPWHQYANPYSVVAWCPAEHPFLEWAEPRRLRQHHGDVQIVGGQIVRRTPEVESLWTADFRVWHGEDPRGALRPGAHYFGLVASELEVDRLFAAYQAEHPGRDAPPAAARVDLSARYQ